MPTRPTSHAGGRRALDDSHVATDPTGSDGVSDRRSRYAAGLADCDGRASAVVVAEESAALRRSALRSHEVEPIVLAAGKVASSPPLAVLGARRTGVRRASEGWLRALPALAPRAGLDLVRAKGKGGLRMGKQMPGPAIRSDVVVALSSAVLRGTAEGGHRGQEHRADASGPGVRSILGQHAGEVHQDGGGARGPLRRPVADLERDELRAYVEHLRGQGAARRGSRCSWPRSCSSTPRRSGDRTDVSFVVWPRQYSPLPTVLSLGEVAALLEALRHPVYLAIAMVLYGTGLRIDEALALEVSDIDGARGVLRVRHGKGNRAREVKLSPALYQWLRRLLEQGAAAAALPVRVATDGAPADAGRGAPRASRWRRSRRGSPSR